MKVSDLKLNDENPRQITKTQTKNLKKSLAAFGDLSGIIFNRQSKQLVGGHQRTKMLPAELEVNIEHNYSAPTKTGTVAEGYIEFNGEKLKYREVDWDEKTEKMANLAANKHGGSWDYEKLRVWISDLSSLNVDMDLTGFDAKERDELIDLGEDDSEDDGEGSGGGSEKELIVAIYFDDENVLEEIFNEMKDRGFKCKIIA